MPRIKAANLAEHREQTMAALLDAVDELADERSLDAVTLRDIAERAGVLRSAIYNYVPDKGALLRAASERSTATARESLREIVEDTGASSADRLERMVLVLLQGVTHDASRFVTARAMQNALSRAEHEETLAPFRAEVQEDVRVVLTQGMATGELAQDLDVDVTASLVIGVVGAAVSWVVEHPQQAEAIGPQTVAFLSRALK